MSKDEIKALREAFTAFRLTATNSPGATFTEGWKAGRTYAAEAGTELAEACRNVADQIDSEAERLQQEHLSSSAAWLLSLNDTIEDALKQWEAVK